MGCENLEILKRIVEKSGDLEAHHVKLMDGRIRCLLLN